MILTVTANACVDKTYLIAGFSLDRVNRPEVSTTVAGGKGVNVARVYQTLGGKACTAGFLTGINGQIIARALQTENIRNEFVFLEEKLCLESRVCTAIIDPNTGTQTEINEAGPLIDSASVEQLLKKFRSLLRQDLFEFVVLSGSLPPGCPVDLYAKLIEICRDYSVRCVLDASGEPLKIGASAKPWMLKPNRFELETLLGKQITDMDSASRLLDHLNLDTDQLIVATFGADGALVRQGSLEWRGKSPPVKFVSAVASGDAFLAGFLWSWSSSDSFGNPAAALAMGLGAGAANAEVIGAGFCSRESIVGRAAQSIVTSAVV